MPYTRVRFLPLFLVGCLVAAACGGGGGDGGGDDDAAGLDAYLPDIPPPTGEAQAVYAGAIDTQNAGAELLPGSAASGTVGDLYMRNSRGRFIIQAPGRVIGVIPQGGNLIDVQPVGPDGPFAQDSFGELSSMYLLGRTCEHEMIEVVQDGSDGGVAAVVARGASAVNDFINIKGIGLLPVDPGLDPDIPDSVECATTYVLAPDSSTMEVYWTFYNDGESDVRGPFAALADTGGNVEVWAPTRGFERLGIDQLLQTIEPAPVPYAVYQGPGVAYGIVPQHDASTPNASFLIAGVSIILYGAEQLFDIVSQEGSFFDLPAKQGVTHAARVVVGRDAAAVEAEVLAAAGTGTRELSGEVLWDSGEPVAGARVGVFEDSDGDGDVGPDDLVVSYMDTDEEGRFSGQFAAASYLLRADLADQARSQVIGSDDGDLAFILDRPVRYDYRVVDDETGELTPAKVLVIGQNPAAADQRLYSTFDRFDGVVAMIQSIRGTSTAVGEEGGDAPIMLAPGADYRVLVTHGTEWSEAEALLSPVAGDDPAELEFRLRRVVDTSGYVASEYHVHSIGSPDSPVEWSTRVATAAADGVEVFASTEHDFIADLQPLVEDMLLERSVRVMPGIEVTPFAYGHFNAWPLVPDMASPNRGAIDWARGAGGFALTPGEIFNAMRERGAELVEVNHPRALPSGLAIDFQNFFDRAGLTFDYANRVISGNNLTQPVPNEFLRLAPDSPLWDVGFNALEVWNGFGTADTDGDGHIEIQSLDVVMRDWFNLLSFGLPITPIGNSDTHTIVRDPMGMPRTLVAVPDDSADALASGSIVQPLIDTLAGRGASPRDVVVTNGPAIRLTSPADGSSVIGRELTPDGGDVQIDISVQSPTWAAFDVIEVFANAVPELGETQTALLPVKCFVTVPPETLPKSDPCAVAPLGAEQIAVDRVAVAEGFERFEASATLFLRLEDPIHPAGGIGNDAWVVVRARGNRSIYPVLLTGIMEAENLETLVSGAPEDVEALLGGHGVPAAAFTAPVYLDLDGGGYRAPFAPE
jgi:hypothetical protein